MYPLGVILKYIFGLAATAVACPMFVEFFPDPTLVSDQEGEYVEIRLDENFKGDSLWVGLDGKAPLRFAYPKGRRLLLSHDNSLCEPRKGLVCESLGSITLPNSRESLWRLSSGSCRDSILLPQPKAGKAFQRVGEGDEWLFTAGTPGLADPLYELDIEDCGLSYVKVEGAEPVWKISGWLSGCDSVQAEVVYQDLFKKQPPVADTITLSGFFSLEIPAGSFRLHLELPEDEAPSNNVLDTLLFTPEKKPLLISEVHHCPEEPIPEWVEVYNPSVQAIALKDVHFCNRGNFLGGEGDSLRPYENALISKDTLALREQILYGDVRLLQVALGYLNNSSGSLSLCYKNSVLDSISWDKSTVACPMGFSPITGRAENTPGFVNHRVSASSAEPFTYKVLSRVVSKRGDPLRVRVENESNVSLKLLDSARREVWKMNIPPTSGTWWNVPVQKYISIGVGYISLSIGNYEKVVGFVLRP